MPDTPFAHRLQMRMEGLPGILQERLARENAKAARDFTVELWIAILATVIAGAFYK